MLIYYTDIEAAYNLRRQVNAGDVEKIMVCFPDGRVQNIIEASGFSSEDFNAEDWKFMGLSNHSLLDYVVGQHEKTKAY